MVHRPLQIALVAAVVLGGACADKKGDDPAAIRAACQTRAQTQSAVNNAKTASVDQYPEVIKGLEAAIKVAPARIRPDFVKVHAVLTPFVNALVKAKGDTELAAQDPNYTKLVAAVSAKDATRAAANIRKFYADNC